jgi:hypothetical protein
MVALFIVLIILAIILGAFGLAITAVKWLLYIAIILLIIAVIGWLLRAIRGRR